MTTLAEAEQLVLRHWLDNWVVGGSPRTETSFEEERIPDGVSVGEDSWVYLSILEIDRSQLTKGRPGNRKFLQKSQIRIAIYTPQSQGTSLAKTLAHEARTIFEGIQLNPLQNFIGADVVSVGPRPPEFIMTVVQPFEFIEVK